jgi:predicted small metal-binding protein
MRGTTMVRCAHPGCSWRPIAPSEDAAWSQYAEHLVEEHTRTVEADVPEGMLQVKLTEDDEWMTVTVEQARRLHDVVHGD